MREIKFRAWDNDENTMIGNVHAKAGYLFRDFLNNPRFILEQFTGLQDSKRTKKYPDGQPIYEGDILRALSQGSDYTDPVVKWDKRVAGFTARSQGIQIDQSEWHNREVISNIHDPLIPKKGKQG